MNGQSLRGAITAAIVASAAIAAPVAAMAAAPVQSIGPVEHGLIGNGDIGMQVGSGNGYDYVYLIATPADIHPVVDRVLVKFKAGTPSRTSGAARFRTFDAVGAQPEDARRVAGLPGVWSVPVTVGYSVRAVERRLDKRADVRWAAPEGTVNGDDVPNDPLFPNLWGLSNTGQQVQAASPFSGVAGMDLGVMGAWGATQGSATVSVAVVDSGVALDHPDLMANLRTQDARNFVPDAQDVVDPLAVDDQHSHGTHVAGTIGAVGNNGLGVAGVNWNVGMIPVRALNFANAGTAASTAGGMAYAGGVARVVNASIGGASGGEVMAEAIQQNPNTLYVVSAGNDGSDNDVTPAYPCNVRLPNVLCVAAIDASGNLADFSNWGVRTVDVAAPGVDIQSTVPTFATEFAPTVQSNGATPPRPVGWNQDSPARWEFDTTPGGAPYVSIDATPSAGSGYDQWFIQAPGTFNPAGRSCRMNAAAAMDLDPGQALAVLYTTTEHPTPVLVGSSATAGDTRGRFMPWTIDLSGIDGQTGVEFLFLVQSPQGETHPAFAAIMNPVVTCIVDQPAGGSYGFMSGTSMASPQVAGAAALLLAKNPDLTAAQMKQALMSTTVPMASLAGKVVTGGRVDVAAALASVSPAPGSAAGSPSAPAPAASSAQAPTTALELRLRSTLATGASGRIVNVPVTCAQAQPTMCSVTVALRMRKGGSREMWINLGTRELTLLGGWSGTVAVPLTREARNLLARHPRVRTTVIAGSQTDSATLASVRQTTTLVRR